MKHYLRDTPYTYQACIAIIIFIVALLYTRSHIDSKSRQKYKISWIICLLYCVFSFCDGDYYHYNEIYLDYKRGYEVWSIENIYLYFFDCSPIYLIFRVLVWGGALMLLYILAKKLCIWNNYYIYVFIAFNLLLFSYARVSLAMTLAVIGYLLLIDSKRVLLKLLGIIILCSSIFFHKSIIIVLFTLPFTLIPWGRKMTIAIIISLPIVIYVVNTYALNYISQINLSDSQNASFNGYVINGNYNDERGIARIIVDVAVQISAYIGLIIMWKYSKNSNLPNIYNYIYRWTVLISLIATAFVMFPFTRIFYYRIMYLARIPELFGITILLNRGLLKKKSYSFKTFMLACWMYDALKLSYSLYLSFVQ